MNYEKQFDNIIEMQEQIPMDGSISVLTGKNCSGKSLVRKLLGVRAKKEKKNLVHASMELRTGMHANLGGLGCMFRDREEASTSSHTIYLVQTASRSMHGGYLCLDEVELGFGEETVMGIVNWFNANIRETLKDTLGCLVITHSRVVVENLAYDHWFNLDGYKTAKAWLNRKIVPTDLEQLRKDDHEFYLYTRKVISENEGKSK